MDHLPPAWERLAERGPLTAFFATIGAVLSGTDRFFRELDPDGPIGPALSFWLLTTLPPLVVSGFSGNRLLDRLLSGELTASAPLDWHIPWWVLPVVAPVVQFASILLGLAIVHLVLRGLKEAHGGWSGTLRAAGYASAPAVLGLVPIAGAPIAGLWAAILQFMALRRVHGARTSALLAAYILPVLAVVLVAVLLVVIAIRIYAPDLGSLVG
ncbi:YIP1 family protein [Gemmatimonadota bacterium]